MTATPAAPSFFIGWDVGAWNCDNNRDSRDAIVIVDASCAIVGTPWWGNLRHSAAHASTRGEWLAELFAICAADPPASSVPITMAIDTPLGFPDAFIRLVTGMPCPEPDNAYRMNGYLFRQTERYLVQHGGKPLSAIADRIGSQATKGMHVRAKFAPTVERCGVWTDGHDFRAIETYPAVCRDAAPVRALMHDQRSLGHPDKDDALICAIVAYLFATNPAAFEPPPDTIPPSEGWIWAPRQSAPAPDREGAV